MNNAPQRIVPTVGCVTGFAAAFLSYALNHSFWWAVLHFFLSWIYILYALILRWADVVRLFL